MGLRLVKIVRAHSWCPHGDDKKTLTANELRLAMHAALVARDSDAPKPWFQQSWQEIARQLGHDRPDAKATLNVVTRAATGLVEKGFWRVDKRAAGGTDGQSGRPVRYVITAWGAFIDGPTNSGNDSGDSPTNSGNDSGETVPQLVGDGPTNRGSRSHNLWDLRSQEENKEELSALARPNADQQIQTRIGCTAEEAADVAADLRTTRPHIRNLAAVLPSITDEELTDSLDGLRILRKVEAQRQAELALQPGELHRFVAATYGECAICGLAEGNRRHIRVVAS